MTRYLLAQHAHLCMTEDHAVILDLHHDAYFALPKDQAAALADVVCDWPRPRSLSTVHQPDRQDCCEAGVRALLSKGLLTTDMMTGKSATPVGIAKPDRPLLATALLHTLFHDSAAPPPRVGVTDVAAFLAAYARATTSIRLKSIEDIVLGIRARRPSTRGGSADPEQMRSLLLKFRLIRPFVYSSMNKCLLDSYVLVEFLARHDLYPLWVFGVRTRPFAAHCWVQEGSFVLNDTPEHAGHHEPIMVV